MIALMCKRLTVSGLFGLALAVTGCGGGDKRLHGAAADGDHAPPVAEQVREALLGALGSPALTGLMAAQQPQLPYRAVRRCMGPAGGGPGRYRCATTPRGSRGVRTVTVRGTADGQWSTEPLRIVTTLRGR